MEGFAPNLLVKVALACQRHRVEWVTVTQGRDMRHYWPFAFAFTLAGMGKGTLLARLARQGCCERCQRRLRLCCCCYFGRLEVVKGKTFATAFALAALALVLIPVLVVQRTVVSVSGIGMSLEELDLHSGLHRYSSLDLSKEAGIG